MQACILKVRLNSYFCPLIYNLLINMFLKDENIKFNPQKYKKYKKYIRSLTFAITINKI